MSQTLQNSENKVWVLVSSLKENANDADLERIAPKVSGLVDQWHSQGKFVWSGPLDNNKSAMAIFEADEDEAKKAVEQWLTTPFSNEERHTRRIEEIEKYSQS